MNLVAVEFPMPNFVPARPVTLAHMAVTQARKKGTLVPMPCSNCGTAGRVHAHHEDYAKPNVIVWLCSKCHGLRHAEMRLALGPKPKRKKPAWVVDGRQKRKSIVVANPTPRVVENKLSGACPPITHAEVAAIDLLCSLPPEKQTLVRRYSMMKGQCILVTIKDGLLKVAEEFASSPSAQPFKNCPAF